MSDFIEFLSKDTKGFVLLRKSIVVSIEEVSDEDDRPYTEIHTHDGTYETWQLYMDVKDQMIGAAE